MAESVRRYMREAGRRARAAARVMAGADAANKDCALLAVADSLRQRRELLAGANAADLAEARGKELPAPLLDRLALDKNRIESMADGLRQVAVLPDPVGEISGLRLRPSGIRVGTMRVPLGVIGIIYESRPSVTADAAGLCIKSGNAAILRGGSEARHSNREIGECVRAGLRAASLPEDAVIVVDTDDRAAVGELLRMQQFVDVVIPRGGRGLIERVSREARMPVIKHLDGICHVYVDDGADLAKAEAIAYNAKTQRYGTCNTMECLLVAEAVAPDLLARLGPRFAAAGVEIRGCAASRRLLPEIRAATPEDYGTEYLAPILSLRIVTGLADAVEHIERYGSRHTDAIVTENLGRAMRFLREVDSSSVLVNASTRFADGCEYGLGAEIGISTDKFHARGPVGLEGLTSCKYVVLGDGQIRR